MEQIILRFQRGERFAEMSIDPSVWAERRNDTFFIHEVLKTLEWGAETQRRVVVAPPKPINPWRL
jgi:hypothetical protein